MSFFFNKHSLRPWLLSTATATFLSLVMGLASANTTDAKTEPLQFGVALYQPDRETDMALMGPWGYVMANQYADAQVVSTILYRGKPEYHAIIITHPDSGINTIANLLGSAGLRKEELRNGETFTAE